MEHLDELKFYKNDIDDKEEPLHEIFYRKIYINSNQVT